MNPLPLVLASLARGRWNALALGFVIAVAVAIGVGITAQERALRAGSARAATGFDLIVGAPGSPTQLVLTSAFLQEAALPLMSGKVLADVGSRKGVTWWAPLAFGDSHEGRPIVGSTATFVTRNGTLAVAEGRMFDKPEEAVVGSAAGLAPGIVVAPTHGHSDESGNGRDAGHEPRHDDHRLTVVGRMAPTGTAWDRAIMVPIESVWETHGLPTGHAAGDAAVGAPWSAPDVAGVPAIVIKAASVSDAYRLRAAHRGTRNEPPTMGVFPGEVLVELYATMGDVRDAMRALAAATQALVLLAIVVAALAIFAGRAREVAALRALGAPRAFVFAALWLEMAAIVIFGTVTGLGLGLVAAATISAVAQARLGFALPVGIGIEEAGTAAAVMLAGLVLSLIPAALAWRRPVAATLRE